ncbi:LuxR family transcriptional regulator [Actinomycetospora sp. TBRC 11914]|uniref:helix-turn-helix transcriptional regulator n=1 Tax=Actinomycetospora sp. TBRC 11914 TaxID=2729387 RepID=UPI00145DB262|nr:LuxR family transcriptional regulator [Actinomycetospora sp. TBRC 11914]NMO92712.1 AAA family ATPase [Actinomycetospora sp. TBRC 11914]
MTGALLERDAELAALGSALRDAEAGAGSVVLLSGEAGIGKTSLVRAFTGDADDRARVLSGACDDLLTPRTLGPLRDAARSGATALAEALHADDRDAILAAARAELAGPGGPTVLVVEDLHWADDATLDVVRYLGRRIADLPAVLLLTFRDEEVGASLRRVLGALGGPSVHRLALARLSRTAVARWSEATTVTSAALYQLTRGNPFYVSEVLASSPPGDRVEVPPTVVDAVLARTRRLDDDVQAALDQLSVVPGEVDLPLARALVGDLAVLGAAETARVLEVRVDAVAFRHELARRAVQSALPTTSRLALNARVLAVLVERPDVDPGRLVHHAVGSGDDAAVVRYGPRAAREAERVGAHAQEIATYEPVLARASLLDPDEHAAILQRCCAAHFSLDHQAAALVAGEAAVRLREGLGDPAALGGALIPLGPTLWALTRPREALATAARAVALLEPAGDSPALAVAMAYDGLLRSTLDRHAEALALAAAALPMALRLGIPEIEGLVRVLCGRLRALVDDPEGFDDLADGRRLAAAGGHHLWVMFGYVLAVQDLWELGRWAEAVEVGDEGLAYASERELDLFTDHLLAHRYRWLGLRGDREAAEAGLRGLVGHRDGGETAGTRYCLPGLARLLVRRGAEDADEVLAWARDYADRADSRYELAPTGLAEIEHAWLRDDHERAHRVAARLEERLAGPGPARQRAELRRWRRRAGEDVGPFDGCPEPWAAGLRGDWEAAAAAWREQGLRYEEALELADSGEVGPTVEALALLDDLGAGPAAARVRRRLRELGVTSVPRGPVPATRANPCGLTDRQMAVLRELADGRTNAEIASGMVVSVRTVDHHVSAVLAKLGVSSRREAVAAAARLGVTA